jgi:hypothetical protein
LQDFSKRWYQSKTLWFNLTTLIVSLSGAAMQFTDQLGLTDAQATTAALVLTLITVFGNSMLRMITSKAIK